MRNSVVTPKQLSTQNKESQMTIDTTPFSSSTSIRSNSNQRLVDRLGRAKSQVQQEKQVRVLTPSSTQNVSQQDLAQSYHMPHSLQPKKNKKSVQDINFQVSSSIESSPSEVYQRKILQRETKAQSFSVSCKQLENEDGVEEKQIQHRLVKIVRLRTAGNSLDCATAENKHKLEPFQKFLDKFAHTPIKTLQTANIDNLLLITKNSKILKQQKQQNTLPTQPIDNKYNNKTDYVNYLKSIIKKNVQICRTLQQGLCVKGTQQQDLVNNNWPLLYESQEMAKLNLLSEAPTPLQQVKCEDSQSQTYSVQMSPRVSLVQSIFRPSRVQQQSQFGNNVANNAQKIRFDVLPQGTTMSPNHRVNEFNDERCLQYIYNEWQSVYKTKLIKYLQGRFELSNTLDPLAGEVNLVFERVATLYYQILTQTLQKRKEKRTLTINKNSRHFRTMQAAANENVKEEVEPQKCLLSCNTKWKILLFEHLEKFTAENSGGRIEETQAFMLRARYAEKIDRLIVPFETLRDKLGTNSFIDDVLHSILTKIKKHLDLDFDVSEMIRDINLKKLISLVLAGFFQEAKRLVESQPFTLSMHQFTHIKLCIIEVLRHVPEYQLKSYMWQVILKIEDLRKILFFEYFNMDKHCLDQIGENVVKICGKKTELTIESVVTLAKLLIANQPLPKNHSFDWFCVCEVVKSIKRNISHSVECYNWFCRTIDFEALKISVKYNSEVLVQWLYEQPELANASSQLQNYIQFLLSNPDYQTAFSMYDVVSF